MGKKNRNRKKYQWRKKLGLDDQKVFRSIEDDTNIRNISVAIK